MIIEPNCIQFTDCPHTTVIQVREGVRLWCAYRCKKCGQTVNLTNEGTREIIVDLEKCARCGQ